MDNTKTNNEGNPKKKCSYMVVLKWISQFNFYGRLLLTLFSVYGFMIVFGWGIQYLLLISTTNYKTKVYGAFYLIIYTFYGLAVSNILVIPLWEFFKFPFLRKTNCFESIFYLILRIIYRNKENAYIYAHEQLIKFQEPTSLYVILQNCFITIFSAIWGFLIAYAYLGFNYFPFDIINTITLTLSLSLYLLVILLYEIYFLLRLITIFFKKKEEDKEPLENLKDNKLIPDDTQDEKSKDIPEAEIKIQPDKEEIEQILTDKEETNKIQPEVEGDAETDVLNVNSSNQSNLKDEKYDKYDPFLRSFDKTFKKIFQLKEKGLRINKYSHDQVIFILVFIVSSIGNILLIVSLINQRENLYYYTYLVCILFIFVFFIPSCTLRFPSWIMRSLFLCCLPKRKPNKFKIFHYFSILSNFVYGFIIVINLALFVLFIFVSEEQQTKIPWTPPPGSETRTNPSRRDYVYPPICYTDLHYISILQLMAFASDAYYTSEDHKIDYLLYSFFPNTDMKIVSKGDITIKGKAGARMVRYDINMTDDIKNVTVFSIKGTSENVDWWLDIQLFFSSALLTITKNAIPIIIKVDSKTYQLASFLFSVPMRALLDLSLIPRYVEELQTAYLSVEEEMKDRSVIFVGHSLGGGLAKIMGKKFVKTSVSLSGPGISIFNNLWNPEDSKYNENFPSTFIDIVPDMDLVPRVEVSGGTYYRIICDSGSGQCHSATRSICMTSVMCNVDINYLCTKFYNFTENDMQHMRDIANFTYN